MTKLVLHVRKLVADAEYPPGVDALRLALECLDLLRRRLKRTGAGAERLDDDEVPEMAQQLVRKPPHVLPGGVERLYRGEDRGDVAGEDGVGEALQGGARDAPEAAQGAFLGDVPAGERDKLVERRERVAHPALGAARNREKRVVRRGDALLPADELQAREDVVRLDAPQVEALAARDDGREDLVALGRGEYEAHVRRRLLERLQQRVPRRVGEHVTFVDYEDPKPGRRRLELHGVDYRLDVLDLVVRGGVKLRDVERPSARDLLAVHALSARLHAVWRRAVEGLGEYSGERGLANPPGADEKVCVGDPPRLYRVAKRPHYVFLPDDVVERHRTVLQRQ